MNKVKKNKAFTIIELIVVIAVLGILILLAMPKFIGHTQDAKLAQIKNDVRAHEVVIDAKRVDAEKDGEKDPIIDWETVAISDLEKYKSENKLFNKRGLIAGNNSVKLLNKVNFFAGNNDVNFTDEHFKVPAKTVNTKLKGDFIVAKGGEVYYYDENLNGFNPDNGPGDNNDVGPEEDSKYDENGFDKDGFDKDGFDKDGFDKDGFDKDGFDKDGFDENGFDKDGNHESGLNPDDAEKIEDLIKSGFIPVASPYELQQINNTSNSVKVWGAGTKFEMNHIGGLDQKYIQVKEIDMSDFQNFNPIGIIGTNAHKFSGTYDGGGFKISNLKINRNYGPVGLFGEISEATIENVGLENVTVTVTGVVSSVGGLVGHSYNSTMSNSYAKGKITGAESRTGGLVGWSNYSTVSESYFIGTVSGVESVGGLVGYCFGTGGTVSNSYAEATVNGTNKIADGTKNGENIGGLVGYNEICTVSNSYATGKVIANGVNNLGGGVNNVGGLVGRNKGKVSNSYATGKVSTKGVNVGGLVGNNYKGTASNSYYDKETTGQSDTGKGTGKTTAEMKEKSTYSGWDFVNNWQINEGVSYPTLK